MNYYHPQTLEHIRNPLPAVADWAKSTELEAPLYDEQTQQCHFKNGSWLVEAVIDPAIQQAKEKQISEAKAYLSATDYKVLPDYTVAPDGEPIADIIVKRASARALIRSLE